MHKKVHQGTRQEQEVRQHTKKMRSMLREHEKSGHSPKPIRAMAPRDFQNGRVS
jgi:hypothetical protein